jgi:hypothetical protein
MMKRHLSPRVGLDEVLPLFDRTIPFDPETEAAHGMAESVRLMRRGHAWPYSGRTSSRARGLSIAQKI